MIHGEPLGSHGSDQLPMGSSQRLFVEPEVLLFHNRFFLAIDGCDNPVISTYNFHSIIIVMTCYNPLKRPEKGY
jgi:hypothetical protein